jgi:ubiquinone/menaquinone biosynthesis C-methylase UbiE
LPEAAKHREARASWEAGAARCAAAFNDNVAPMLAVFAEGAVERAGIRPGARVLDLWCGTGIVTAACALRAGAGGLAVGVDAVPPAGSMASALRSARRAGPHSLLLPGDASALPFAAGTFDAAVSAFGVPLWQRDAEFAEAHRALRPGGTLSLVHLGPAQIEPMGKVEEVVSRFRTDHPSAQLKALREAARSVEGMRADVRTPAELERAAVAAGFGEVSTHTAHVRQRMWGITNFLDVCLSFPLAHAEHAEMGADAKDLFITVGQEVLLPYMDLEEFIATAELVYVTARRPEPRH